MSAVVVKKHILDFHKYVYVPYIMDSDLNWYETFSK